MPIDDVSKKGINGNTLKIIASIAMLIDHVGVMLFPKLTILRIIGRIAFPIFAFMIAEGCFYTRNKFRYFLLIFILGVGCQLVYYFTSRSLYLGILITFSISILVVYAMQFLKNAIFATQRKALKICFAVALFVCSIIGVYFLNKFFVIDYGFWGCLAPVFASVFRKPTSNTLSFFEKVDNRIVHGIMLGVSLILLSANALSFQYYSLFAVLLLLFYSGERGKCNMKYFFYIFYPLHLVVIEGISYLL